MTAAEIIWDVMELKHALEDDADIDELWILQKFNAYRAMIIQQDYAYTNKVNPSWLQRLHRLVLSKVNAADDPAISLSSVIQVIHCVGNKRLLVREKIKRVIVY